MGESRRVLSAFLAWEIGGVGGVTAPRTETGIWEHGGEEDFSPEHAQFEKSWGERGNLGHSLVQ